LASDAETRTTNVPVSLTLRHLRDGDPALIEAALDRRAGPLLVATDLADDGALGQLVRLVVQQRDDRGLRRRRTRRVAVRCACCPREVPGDGAVELAEIRIEAADLQVEVPARPAPLPRADLQGEPEAAVLNVGRLAV